ncbi:MAG: dephospho-CoA kinase [Kiritimatiellae bacterium]|nr:dephospho-CoA kinase [Kiritimatiellia bacterium]
MRIALTGSIACGKSLVAKFLNDIGIETLDADDVVHGIIPEEERRRLAKKVFADPAARAELEAKIHPLVEKRLDEWARQGEGLRVEIIPLLFEVHWDAKYDIICAVISEEETQIARMTEKRGYSREDAKRRLAAQLPSGEKARKSHYVIRNDGSTEELKREVERFAVYLRGKENEHGRGV